MEPVQDCQAYCYEHFRTCKWTHVLRLPRERLVSVAMELVPEGGNRKRLCRKGNHLEWGQRSRKSPYQMEESRRTMSRKEQEELSRSLRKWTHICIVIMLSWCVDLTVTYHSRRLHLLWSQLCTCMWTSRPCFRKWHPGDSCPDLLRIRPHSYLNEHSIRL